MSAGPRADRCVQNMFHQHVGICHRAGYRNGAADVLDAIEAAIPADLRAVAYLIDELRERFDTQHAAPLPEAEAEGVAS